MAASPVRAVLVVKLPIGLVELNMKSEVNVVTAEDVLVVPSKSPVQLMKLAVARR